MVQNIRETQKILETNLKQSIELMKEQADKNRVPSPRFQVGDYVVVNAKHLKIDYPTKKKLGPLKLGPFKILKHNNHISYHLELPPHSKAHPVFHVSHLKGFYGKLPQHTVVTQDGIQEFGVESVLKSRVWQKKVEYFLKWEWMPVEHGTWEPVKNCQNMSELIRDFHLQNPDMLAPTVQALVDCALDTLKDTETSLKKGGDVRVRKRGWPKKTPTQEKVMQDIPAKINCLDADKRSLVHDQNSAMNKCRMGEAKKLTIYRVRETGCLELIRIIKANSDLHDTEFFGEVMRLSSITKNRRLSSLELKKRAWRVNKKIV